MENLKKQKAQELKQNWHEKKMDEQFVREMPDKVDKDKTWQWLSKSEITSKQKRCYVLHWNRPSRQTI